MCTFDSPIERCEAMHAMVLTDQTQRDCAREHHCPKGTACPLCNCFTGVDWQVASVVKPGVRGRVSH